MSLFSNFPQSPDAEIKEEIAALENRVQTVDKGGTGATTAAQALANLGGIAAGAVGNVHVWQRVQQNLEAGYELGQGSLTTILSADTNTITALSYYVCDSISVASDGTVSPVSEEKVVIKFTSGTAHTGTDALKGKFGRKSQTSSTFYFFPSNCVFTDYVVTKHNIQASNAQLVTGYPAGTTTDYLTSTDRNAYPDNVTDAQDAYYSLGDVVSGNIINAAGSVSVGFYYSDTISVDSEGNIIIPTTNTISLYDYKTTNTDTIKGKFIKLYTSDGDIVPFSGVIYIPSDSVFSINSGLYCSAYQTVTGHAAIPANTTITYLGQLGDKVRIKVGSYVGTGTATTVINLGFTPAIVWVQRAGMTGGYTAYDGYGAIALTGASVATSDVTRLKIVDGGFQVTQADSTTNSKDSDLNRSGKSYVYIAVP